VFDYELYEALVSVPPLKLDTVWIAFDCTSDEYL